MKDIAKSLGIDLNDAQISKLENDVIGIRVKLFTMQLISGFVIALQSVLLIWTIFENTCP